MDKEIFDGIFEKYKLKKYLTFDEKKLLQEIVKVCLPTHHLSKPSRLKQKIPVGEKMEYPLNPANGFVYSYERKNVLQKYNQDKNGCNQFASKIQWLQLGRIVKESAEAATVFMHSKGGEIKLYAYEQTDPA